jgi:hypothetical protein
MQSPPLRKTGESETLGLNLQSAETPQVQRPIPASTLSEISESAVLLALDLKCL